MSSLVNLFLQAPAEHAHAFIVDNAKRHWDTPMPTTSQCKATLDLTAKYHASRTAVNILHTILMECEELENPRFDNHEFKLRA